MQEEGVYQGEEAVLGNHFFFAEACIILASFCCASTRPRLQDIFVLQLHCKGRFIVQQMVRWCAPQIRARTA